MNTIKRGAIFGLISFVLSIIFISIVGYQTIVYYTNQIEINYSTLSTILLNLVLLISCVGMIFYYLAFLKLGEKYKDKLLTVMSWIFIIFAYLNLLLTFVSVIVDLVKAQETSPITDSYIMIFLLIILILLIIIFSTLIILFGIGIKKLGNKIKYSRITGILYIISGATMIILIGFILVLVANFYSIALLFNESKKYQEIGKDKKQEKKVKK